MSERRETWTVKRIAYPIREGAGRIHETFCYQVIGDDGKAVANAFTSEMAGQLANLPDLVDALRPVAVQILVRGTLNEPWRDDDDKQPIYLSVRQMRSVVAALAEAGA